MTNYDLKNAEAAFAIPVHSRQFAGDLRFPLSRRFASFRGSLRFEPLRPTPSNSDLLRPKEYEGPLFLSRPFAYLADPLFADAIRTNPDKTPPPPTPTLLIFRHFQSDTL